MLLLGFEFWSLDEVLYQPAEYQSNFHKVWGNLKIYKRDSENNGAAGLSNLNNP